MEGGPEMTTQQAEDINEMNPYTGIAEDHRVEVSAFDGVRKTEDTLEIAFTGPEGRTLVQVPFFRLELSLGADLAHWLAVALPESTDTDGKLIKASDLVYPYLEAGKLVLLFVERDEETVAVSLPKSEARKALGDRLCSRLLERGEHVRKSLMQRYNEALASE